MPYLYAPDQAINRKFKVLYAPAAGINCKQKSLWAPDQGINRKIFSSGLSATVVGVDSYSGTNNYDYGGPETNYSDANNFSIYGTTGLSDGSAASKDCILRGWFSLPVDPTNIAQGTQLLSFNGNYTVSNKVGTFLYLYLNVYAGSNRNQQIGSTSFNTPLPDGNGTSSSSFIVSATQGPFSGYSAVSVELYAEVTGVTGAGVQLSFPWSNLTWLPTGDKIQLAT